MKSIHVAASPITGTVFAGYVMKDGRTWGSGKRDVTGEACAAVAEHALANGGHVTVSANGVPLYEITVKRTED